MSIRNLDIYNIIWIKMYSVHRENLFHCPRIIQGQQDNIDINCDKTKLWLSA